MNDDVNQLPEPSGQVNAGVQANLSNDVGVANQTPSQDIDVGSGGVVFAPSDGAPVASSASPTTSTSQQSASAADSNVTTNDDTANQSIPDQNAPQIADDVDLIEKAWVEKAKEIVEKTRDNPYLQNKALGQYKANYIKKRYNKDVPIGE